MRGPALPVTMRWLIRADLPAVAAIDAASFSEPWSADELLAAIRTTGGSGAVAEDDEDVVGFVIYDLQPARIVVRRLAVTPAFRRRGIGRALLDRVRERLYSSGDRRSIYLEVPEDSLSGQLWLRSLGVPCVRIRRDERVYLFQERRLQQ